MKRESEGAITLTKVEAKRLLDINNEGMVHTFNNMPFGLIGFELHKETILKYVDDAVQLQLAGPDAQKMKHALAIFETVPCKQSEVLFVQTIPEEVEKLNKKVKVMK